MERIQHDLIQGTAAWDEFRLEHDGASEAAAMLGLSTLTMRNEMLHLKHTGIAKDFSDWVQKHVLDYGHEVEAQARPIVEGQIGEDLYPVTFSYGQISASCDGLTMDETTAWEHKQWAAELAAFVMAGTVPDTHMPQCQQVLLVTGAQKLIFTVSDGTEENMVSTTVLPDPAWFKRIEDGWKQFHEDLLDYSPVEYAPKPVPAPVKDLPALVYRLNGLALTSNLPEYKAAAVQLVEDSKRDLVTDQDFADRDTLCKAFKVAEQSIELKKKQVLGEITDVDTFCRALDEIGALIRQARLAGEKMVEAEKTKRKEAIVADARAKWREFMDRLGVRLGKPYMPAISPDFGLAIKGLKSLESMNNAVDTLLANEKIAAIAIADRIQENMTLLDAALFDGYGQLFADQAQIVLKAPDDLKALITVRINNEKQRVEAERERIRAEEQAKAEREVAAKVKAEQDALEAKAREEERARQVAEATPAQAPSPAPTPATETTQAIWPFPKAPVGAPTLTLGNLGKRLGFDVRADFLRTLGFEGQKERAATLYHESDFPRICAAIIAHIQNVSGLRAAA